jgi:hypothetical protein
MKPPCPPALNPPPPAPRPAPRPLLAAPRTRATTRWGSANPPRWRSGAYLVTVRPEGAGQ